MMKHGIFTIIFVMALSFAMIEVNAFPFSPFLCFDPSTTVEMANGKNIAMEDLQVGDEIVSCKSVDNGNCGSHFVDYVTDVRIIEENGPFSAHTFVFENNKQINVTSPHIMYIYKEINGKMIPVTTAAKDVKVEDVMKFQDGSFYKIVQAIDINLAKKVSINTAGGSFFANEVLTTGMCESYQEEEINAFAKTVLDGYADSHKGINSWILAQKDLSMSPDVFVPACLSKLS